MDEWKVDDKLIDDEEEMLFDIEYSLCQLHYKVDKIVESVDLEERAIVCRAILDKFDDYMQNVGRLNMMINEFKGLVAIVRSEFKGKENEKKVG